MGFLRHAPPQALYGQLDNLLHRRKVQVSDEGQSDSDAPVAKPARVQRTPLGLPRASPYVGSRRHAPPSPMLRFSVPPRAPHLRLLAAVEDGNREGHLPLPSEPDVEADFLLPSPRWTVTSRLPGGVPEEVWTSVMQFAAEVRAIGWLSAVCLAAEQAIHSQEVWRGRTVRVSASALSGFAPALGTWLLAWRSVNKLVVPRSSQVLAELSRRAPELPVEVAWRFDTHLKGDGVEVLSAGRSVRRVANEELVVMGDAAIPCGPGRPAYLEVRLDERISQVDGAADELNDFGLGVTRCDPEELRELGAVAGEVPQSWVVDFTQTSVVLSVNNHEAAKGCGASAEDLREGDRVGLRFMADAIEVFINGVMRERLKPDAEERVPRGVGLYAVLDLYGLTTQISRTDAEAPVR